LVVRHHRQLPAWTATPGSPRRVQHGYKARDNLSLSKRYYEPINLDTGYWNGWLGILGLGVDYFNGGGGANQGMDTNVGSTATGARSSRSGRRTASRRR
jgi:hypothetical protein